MDQTEELTRQVDELMRQAEGWADRARSAEEKARLLRIEVAELKAMAQDLPVKYVALYEGREPELYATADAAKESLDIDIGSPWDWIPVGDGWQQWRTDPDTDAPIYQESGEVIPVQVKVPKNQEPRN